MVLHIVLACYMKKCLFFSIFNRVFTNLYRKSIKYRVINNKIIVENIV